MGASVVEQPEPVASRAFIDNPIQLYLEEYRRSFDMTNSDLARKLGLHPPTTNRITNGDHLPSIYLFSKICLKIEIPPDVILRLLTDLSTYMDKRNKTLYNNK
jgi:DNA-binding XRE family transcriptional regulator